MPSADRFHHVTLTVTNLESSVRWYEDALGLTRVADRQGDGWTRALLRSPTGLVIGLTQHHATGSSDRFDPIRVGLDHLSISCGTRAEVEQWASHLDSIGVAHAPIDDAPAGHVLVCTDPDGIPVEFFAST